MEKEYWENYYKNHKEPLNESSFAKYVSKYLEKDKFLIELGCGNGRDSIFFSKSKLNVTGIDQCENEISYLNKKYSSKNLNFISGDFTKMSENKKYDYIYSRFTLHSIDEKAENRVLSWTQNSLNKNGLFFLELRSVKDEMFDQGKKIGEYEAVTDHYRRFAEFDKLKGKLKEKGFKIIESIESNGLAKSGNEDPVIIRFVVKK